VQKITGKSVEVTFACQSYMGAQVTVNAEAEGIRLNMVKLPEEKKGFALSPRRWIVKCTVLCGRKPARRRFIRELSVV